MPKSKIKRERSEENDYNRSFKSESPASDVKREHSSNINDLNDDEEFVVPKVEYDADIERMEQMGLPLGFNNLNTSGKSSKKKKTEFICQLCDCVLSSEIAKASHVKGEKHLKLKKIRNQKKSDAGIFTNTKVREPEAGKKKVPIRLHQKIMESTEPAIGLSYVEEFIPISNKEMEPHYCCTLCNNQGIANGMFSHVHGKKHRLKVVEKVYPDDPTEFQMKDLRAYAMEHRENGEAEHLIKTITSDELYPWPKEDKPWALENDGTNVAPEGAIENFGITKNTKQQKFSIREEILPHPSEITAPTNKDEAEQLIRFYAELMKGVADSIGGDEGRKAAAHIDQEVALLRQDPKLLPNL
jgi:hypothetical protein